MITTEFARWEIAVFTLHTKMVIHIFFQHCPPLSPPYFFLKFLHILVISYPSSIFLFDAFLLLHVFSHPPFFYFSYFFPSCVLFSGKRLLFDLFSQSYECSCMLPTGLLVTRYFSHQTNFLPAISNSNPATYHSFFFWCSYRIFDIDDRIASLDSRRCLFIVHTFPWVSSTEYL